MLRPRNREAQHDDLREGCFVAADRGSGASADSREMGVGVLVVLIAATMILTKFDTPAMYRVKAHQFRRRAAKLPDGHVRRHLFERAAACERKARWIENRRPPR